MQHKASMAPPYNSKRKILLSVKDWSSEESIHTWKFLKSHLLQTPKDGNWNDELLVVHISKGKDKDKERWDHGNAVISDLSTSLQPYQHDVYDLEGDPGPLIVDIANREQASILVLATRGRTAMKKAMMGGSMTDFVIQRVNCPCLVVKPQIGAGDTYRMKTAAQPQAAPQYGSVTNLQPSRTHSPGGSPLFRMGSNVTTPFNRRVAIVYDTTASGRFLLKWATETILEPPDNVFVVRAVPKVKHATTSFADKNSVQRLAADVLPGQAHVTTFNVQFSPQQGNRCRSVLSFVAKESVDLLIIGLYKPSTQRKGLALRGNALAMANRSACSCLVVPMSEAALTACAEASDLAITAEEEEELASGSESETDEDEPVSPTAAAAAQAEEEAADAGGVVSGSPDAQAGSFALRGKEAMKQIRAPLEALFKRRGSTVLGGSSKERDGEGATSSAGGGLPSGIEARRAALVASLQGSGGGLPAGKYVVEVDNSGAVKHIKVLADKHHVAPLAIPAAEGEAIQVLTPADEAKAADGASAADAGTTGSAGGRAAVHATGRVSPAAASAAVQPLQTPLSQPSSVPAALAEAAAGSSRT